MCPGEPLHVPGQGTPGCCALLGRPFLPEGDLQLVSQSPKACKVAKLAFLNIHRCDQMNRTSRAI